MADAESRERTFFFSFESSPGALLILDIQQPVKVTLATILTSSYSTFRDAFVRFVKMTENDCTN